MLSVAHHIYSGGRICLLRQAANTKAHLIRGAVRAYVQVRSCTPPQTPGVMTDGARRRRFRLRSSQIGLKVMLLFCTVCLIPFCQVILWCFLFFFPSEERDPTHGFTQIWPRRHFPMGPEQITVHKRLLTKLCCCVGCFQYRRTCHGLQENTRGTQSGWIQLFRNRVLWV